MGIIMLNDVSFLCLEQSKRKKKKKDNYPFILFSILLRVFLVPVWLREKQEPTNKRETRTRVRSYLGTNGGC